MPNSKGKLHGLLMEEVDGMLPSSPDGAALMLRGPKEEGRYLPLVEQIL